MFRTPRSLWALLLIIPLLLTGVISAQDTIEDEDTQQPTARVARISFLEGEAQIQRTENEEWETVVDNLPLVEGDTIQTEKNSKLEIQLDRYSFLRLDGDSVLKFTFLNDDGIALSLSRGSLGVTLVRFDKKQAYLEIDAPDSTIAIQKSGVYRIDAGDEYNKEVRVSARDDGEARIYSSDSGFTLKDGRTARLFLEGALAGEWETSRSSKLSDNFDSWNRDQDERVAANLVNLDSQYYDDDVYGADELRDKGEWVYTSNYGYVWRPYTSTIARYANWSPYRYGQWRWLPFYGWTWINDEPWGWATYHYGRWIYVSGRWCWTPYRQYRSGRSWRPAIVYVTYIGDSYCWYPLPWGWGYYDYNRRFRNRWDDRRGYGRGNGTGRGNGNGTGRGNGNGTGNGNGNPTSPPIPQANIDRGNRTRTPPLGSVPPTGVITVPAGEWGKAGRGYREPQLSVAKQVLKQSPVINESPPILPSFDDVNRKVGKGVIVSAPTRQFPDVKTGATARKSEAPLDEKLQREKMYGNRTPREESAPAPQREPMRTTGGSGTGVFDRSRRPETKQDDSGTVATPPIYTPRESKPAQRPTYTPETKQPETRQPDRRPSPPVSRPDPPQESKPRYEPPPPRHDPPRAPAPRQEPERKAPERKAPEQKPPSTKSADPPSSKEKPDNR